MEKVFEAEYELTKFKIIYDIDKLVGEFANCKYDSEEDYEDDGKSIPIGADDGQYNTMEEYNQNVDDFVAKIKNFDNEESLLNAISAFPKKKNGTFKKNQVLSIARLNNSYYSEDEYGWPCDELRLKPIDDTTLELRVDRVVIHW